MTWLIDILKIYLKEFLLLKHYVMNNLIQQKIGGITDINAQLLQLFINSLIKRLWAGAVKITPKKKKKLAKELQKTITKKVEKQKVHSSFIDNIWGC